MKWEADDEVEWWRLVEWMVQAIYSSIAVNWPYGGAPTVYIHARRWWHLVWSRESNTLSKYVCNCVSLPEQATDHYV